MKQKVLSQCCDAEKDIILCPLPKGHLIVCSNCGKPFKTREDGPKEEDPEIVICAAIRMKDGYIVRGHRHSDALRTAAGIPRYKGDSHAWGENQGFVTSKNRYVSRIEGAKLQKAAGISSKMPEGQEYLHGELYSEDLY